ncbi:hypothetical protein ACEQPO_30890 [Bacillus sp. SL00103]
MNLTPVKLRGEISQGMILTGRDWWEIASS